MHFPVTDSCFSMILHTNMCLHNPVLHFSDYSMQVGFGPCLLLLLLLGLLASMYSCLHCEFSTRHLQAFLKHHAEIHITQHRIKCPVTECHQTFQSLRTVKCHLLRKHKAFSDLHLKPVIARHVQQPADDQSNNSSSSDEDLSEDNNDAVHFAQPDPKQVLAKKLLALREVHKLPSSAIAAFASEVGILMDMSHTLMAQNVKDVMHQSGTEIPEALNAVLDSKSDYSSACDQLDSQAKLETYAKRHLPVIMPKELDIGDGNTIQYIPLKETLQQFISVDAVYKDIISRKQSHDDILRDVVDGDVFTNHQRQSPNHCLEIILYFDEFTVTNPLRQRSRKYKILACYMTLANLSPQHRFQSPCIHLVLLAKSCHVKRYGLTAVNERLINDLRSLIADGVTRPTNDENFNCNLFCVVGDNLSQHQIGGFVESFTANFPCRFCNVHRDRLRAGHLGESRRPPQHDAQVAAVQANPELVKSYGVKDESIFHGLGDWHCVTHMPSDIAHDVFEGVAKKLLQLVLSRCVRNGYVTLPTINQRISSFDYKGTDKRDKPAQLIKGTADSVKVKQTFSQTWCLIRLMPMMIGDWIPRHDAGWLLLLKFLHILEWICAPSLRRGHVVYVKEELEEFYADMQTVFQNEMTPKEHFLLHYSDQMFRFGPLRNLWTFRLEGKHQYFIDVVKLNRCHKNICKTLAERHQYHHCISLDSIFKKTVTLSGAILVSTHDVPPQFRGAVVRLCSSREVQVAKSILIGNTMFRCGLVIPVNFVDGTPLFHRIMSCFIIDSVEYVGVCHLGTLDFDAHHNAYLVQRSNIFDVVAVSRYYDIATLGVYKIPDDNAEAVVLKHRYIFPTDDLCKLILHLSKNYSLD